MSIPLERIVALIGATPGIRLVELADQMDEDAGAIERALAPALANGSIRVMNVPIFGGKQMASYTLKTLTPSSAAPVSAPPPAPITAVAEIESKSHAPLAAETRKPRGAYKVDRSKVRRKDVDAESMAGRALAFILSQPGRRASNDDLRKHLAIPKGMYPSNYFRRYVEDGTLVSVLNGWAATPLDVGGRAYDAREQTIIPAQDGGAATDPHELRYALWSDGMLELRRGAMTVALLTVAERIALRAFLAVGAPV